MKLHEKFIEQLQALLPDEWEALAEAITTSEPSVAVRVNDARLVGVPEAARRVPWCDLGFYLADRPAFTFDPDWHAGRYYVQDASSMFIAHVIRQFIHQPVRYLDLCAAPGGKTTAAIQALPQQSLVVANEIVPPRARVLADNIIRWGDSRCVVTSNAPAHVGKLTHFFDVIAADVPCSGEGMMRKDDEAVAQWSPALVGQCAQRQREILADVWNALRPGGLLIYSTCTYNHQENEQMADFIVNELGATSLEVPVEPQWNIHPAIGSECHCYRFMPHRVDGEGLFMAVFRKDGDSPRQDIRVKDKNAKKADEIGKNWLSQPDDYVVEQQGDLSIAVPADIRREVTALRASLMCRTPAWNWLPSWAARSCRTTLWQCQRRGLPMLSPSARWIISSHCVTCVARASRLTARVAASSSPIRVPSSVSPTTWAIAPTTSTPSPNASSAPTSPIPNQLFLFWCPNLIIFIVKAPK